MRITFAVVVAVLLGLSVKTAVANSPVVNNWTGFYIGGNVGWAWGESDFSSNFSCSGTFGSCSYNAPVNFPFFNAQGSGSLNDNGFTGGVQGGYNWQFGGFVVGLEADFGAFSINPSRTLIAFGPSTSTPITITVESETNWLLTTRGRLGWLATPNVLLFATGGLAVTDLSISNAFSDQVAPVTSGSSSHSKTLAGFAVGGGFEWMLDRNWSVKGEYLYIDFGSVTTTAQITIPGAGLSPNTLATSADVTAHVARLGFNYAFR